MPPLRQRSAERVLERVGTLRRQASHAVLRRRGMRVLHRVGTRARRVGLGLLLPALRRLAERELVGGPRHGGAHDGEAVAAVAALHDLHQLLAPHVDAVHPHEDIALLELRPARGAVGDEGGHDVAVGQVDAEAVLVGLHLDLQQLECQALEELAWNARHRRQYLRVCAAQDHVLLSLLIPHTGLEALAVDGQHGVALVEEAGGRLLDVAEVAHDDAELAEAAANVDHQLDALRRSILQHRVDHVELLLLPRTFRLRERSRSLSVLRLDGPARVEHSIVGVFGRALYLDFPVHAGSRSRELLLELVNVCARLRALRGGDALFERLDGRFFDLVAQLSVAEIELNPLLLLQGLAMQRVSL
eukprot:scaffold58377_cov58-Phaeocystis_antarctica.AAC.4